MPLLNGVHDVWVKGREKPIIAVRFGSRSVLIGATGYRGAATTPGGRSPGAQLRPTGCRERAIASIWRLETESSSELETQ